ncbi:copper-binding protein [Seohaeicola nanhaiensis]|uniref:Copper-binding protein n=1 Tax=Seohaeicola nanhaiensis TaxID=1387282 RepID=A0ABV9KMC0_9RHOB
MSDGTVIKVDATWNKVTIDHGPLENLDMPAMTMVFVVADRAMLEDLSEGSKLRFVADRVNGKLTVTEIEMQWTRSRGSAIRRLAQLRRLRNEKARLQQ